MIKLENLDKAAKLLPDYRRKEAELRRVRCLVVLNIGDGVDRELRDYTFPSSIGIAFDKIKAALIELHEKELRGIADAMRALGVETDDGATP